MSLERRHRQPATLPRNETTKGGTVYLNNTLKISDLNSQYAGLGQSLVGSLALCPPVAYRLVFEGVVAHPATGRVLSRHITLR